jgi:transcription-repair coupling factor (superfamily II helicase)
MYKRDKTLKEVAEKRLQAIKEFTDLGSGFKIAMRDLEIRGAGNLLGKVQHGHMEAVGYDLYCKMLNEAVKKEKGIETIEDFNTIVDLDVDAFIPNEYIMNEYQKLDIYKRIASCLTLAECDEMYDEMKDRFGNVPKSAENLLRISQIRLKAHKLYVVEIKGKNGEIRLMMHNGAKIKVENIPLFLQRHKKDLSFQASGTPTFIYKYIQTGIVEKDAENLLVYTSKLLDEMEEMLL